MNILLNAGAKLILCSAGAVLVAGGSFVDCRVAQGPPALTQGVKTPQPQAPDRDLGRWQVPTYMGLTLGKSTADDAVRTFGEPIWSGPPEEKLFDSDPEDELLYEYRDVGGVEGQTTLVLGARSRLIKAISIYPRQPLTLQQATEQYGDRYVERETQLGPCPTEAEVRDFKPSPKREYPVFRVYPERGLYLGVTQEGTVTHIGYIVRCP